MRVPALGLWLALAAAAAFAQVAVPPLQARVTDLTGTLSGAQRAALEQRLAAFEQQKGSQIAVLMVPTTQPETIEQYGIRVAEAWKLGRKGVDDGVILLVASDDRALRLEVGYGLEGALPDAIAKRIIEETVTPYFRNGDFHGGIAAGIEQVIKVIEGEPLPEAPQRRRGGRGVDPFSLFFTGFVILAISQVLGRAIGEFKSSLLASGVFGFIAWSILGLVIGGVVCGVILFVLSLVQQSGRGGGGWSNHGGFGGGGFGRSGGFGGGGGFSGGGGGFGGGGASGRW